MKRMLKMMQQEKHDRNFVPIRKIVREGAVIVLTDNVEFNESGRPMKAASKVLFPSTLRAGDKFIVLDRALDNIRRPWSPYYFVLSGTCCGWTSYPVMSEKNE
jgi:hypothetical protein